MKYWLKTALQKDFVGYTLVSLLIAWPWLRPGFVLTLDMVFTPTLRLPSTVTNTYPFFALLHYANVLLPSELLEKVLLFGILIASGIGAHRLAQWLLPATKEPLTKWAPCAAGLLFMINPFVYSRFMAGQYLVLLGYALLPRFLRALLRFLEAPAWKNMLWVSALTIAIGIVSIHDVGMLGIVAGSYGALQFWRLRTHSARLRTLARYSALSIVLVVAASSYWLFPGLLHHGATAQTIGHFSSVDRAAFATTGGNAASRVVHVLRLQGFWMDSRGLYVLPQEAIVAWGLFMLLLWVVVAIGIRESWRYSRGRTIALMGVMGLAIILAEGTLTGWLATHLPFFAGYREPQKFVALVALGYAIFGAFGAARLARIASAHRVLRAGTVVGLGVLPIILALPMFNGFDNQLAPKEYPSDWAEINTQLNADPASFKTLFLPWHQYMYFSFADRIIASPAEAYFDKPTIVSNDPQYKGVAPEVADPLKQRIQTQILPGAPAGTHLGAQLAPLGVKYIIVAQDDDYQYYNFLNQQTDLQLINATPSLALYFNQAFKGAAQ
ncbi:MAG TPA: hypothetical protein VLF60_00630 [Candidatus Saccharimonadales bacterium]|nr:hypothetical protein [Candidatus Saccharimonadales bacterium]